jgi:hypothetical protein
MALDPQSLIAGVQHTLAADERDPAAMRLVAERYRDACAAVNERIARCLQLLQQGQRQQVLAVAYEQPPLIATAQALLFPERGRWLEFVREHELPAPPPLRVDLLAKIGEACAADPLKATKPNPAPPQLQLQSAPTSSVTRAQATGMVAAAVLVGAVLLGVFVIAATWDTGQQAPSPSPVAELPTLPGQPVDKAEQSPSAAPPVTPEDQRTQGTALAGRPPYLFAPPLPAPRRETPPAPAKPAQVFPTTSQSNPAPVAVTPPVTAKPTTVRASATPKVTSARFASWPQTQSELPAFSKSAVVEQTLAPFESVVLWTAAVPPPTDIDLLGSDACRLRRGEMPGEWSIYGNDDESPVARLTGQSTDACQLSFQWLPTAEIRADLARELRGAALRCWWSGEQVIFLLSPPVRSPELALQGSFERTEKVQAGPADAVAIEAVRGFDGVNTSGDAITLKADRRIALQASLIHGGSGDQLRVRMMFGAGDAAKSFHKLFTSLAKLREAQREITSLNERIEAEVKSTKGSASEVSARKNRVARFRRELALAVERLSSGTDKKAVETLNQLAPQWEEAGLPSVGVTIYRAIVDPTTGKKFGIPVQVFGEHRAAVVSLEP